MELRRINPFGSERMDLGFATVAAVTASCHARKGASIKISDFMPEFDKPATAQEDKVAASMMGFIAAHNAAMGAK